MDPNNWRSDAKQLAQRLSFAADCINYYLRMTKLHDCNDCGAYGCAYKPEWGEDVRVNCPHWEPEED